jgi:hypothetical protein
VSKSGMGYFPISKLVQVIYGYVEDTLDYLGTHRWKKKV